MRIFLMWSGDSSRLVGEAASRLLQQTLGGAKVFISTQMPAGSLWKDELTKNLREANVGIACFTRENLVNPWIHYESGMIAKMPDHRLCTLRIGLETIAGPLEDRQSTDASDEESMFHLVLTLNNDRPRTKRKTEPLLRDMFDEQWEDFSTVVQNVLHGTEASEPQR